VPSKHDPRDAFADIVENIVRIEAYIADLDRDALARDSLRRDAVERCLERVCEAAVRLGDRAAELAPDQPWNDIRGMGNWLRHAYDRVNFEILWNTVSGRLPILKADAMKALEQLGGDA
jgi:uncharacterized protein with HEPN domain